MDITVHIPTPRELLRLWKWGLALLPALVLLVTIILVMPGAGPATATGGGNSIQTPDSTNQTGLYSSLQLDNVGNPVVAYQTETAELGILHCDDANCVPAGNVLRREDTGVTLAGVDNSLVLDTSGFPVVSYYEATNKNLKLLHCNDVNCDLLDDSVEAPDTADDVGAYTSLALDGSGFPVISYFYTNNTISRLRIMHCNDANCGAVNGAETFQEPDATDGGGFTSLALDASGFPVVSYQASNGSLRVLHCNDVNCAGGDDSVTTPAGGLVNYTSLALDASGFPVVAYYESVGGDVKILHCNDANCGGGGESLETPDSTGNVGWNTSLVLDCTDFNVNKRSCAALSGNPVVSYHDQTNTDLKVMHCNDVNCAGGNESFQSPDTLGGQMTSLALDDSGNPVVSYYFAASTDLRVLHCGDANCVGKPPTPTPTLTLTPTPTPTATLTPTATPVPNQVNITKLGQYNPPKSCYNVLDGSQALLFQVCDNDWQGAPASHAACSDGVCNDEDLDQGEISLAMVPGSYTVTESVAPPNHRLNATPQPCNASGGNCGVTIIDTPMVRPWFPWDLVGVSGVCAGPDGRITVSDILEVVRHYQNEKPYPGTPTPVNPPTPTPGTSC